MDENQGNLSTNALDYMRFVVQYTEDVVESVGYSLPGLSFDIPGPWNDGDRTTQFLTDDSLCYQMICPPQAVMSVRGILKFTPETERGAKYLTMMFDEPSPEIGKTYSYDMEFQVTVNSRYYLDASHAYWLKPDGTVKQVNPNETADVK